MDSTVVLGSHDVDQEQSTGLAKLGLIGALSGLMGGFFGVGGGIILVPLLVWVGLQRHRAHATSLASFIVIAAAGAVSYGIAGDIDVRFGLAIGVGGIVGSVVGASLMHRMSARALGIAFAAVLLVAGVRMVLGGEPLPGVAGIDATAQIAAAFGIGLVSGLFAGLVGIGGGVVIVPASVLLLGLEQHVAQGTSLVAIVLTAIAGSVVNVRNRRVQIKDSMFIGAGGVVGTVFGTRLALGTDGRTLSVAFGFLVLFVAFRSLYQTIREPQTA
jgi:uncharacterized membrane protein YfcA